MTHRGPFQPLLFCDSVKVLCNTTGSLLKKEISQCLKMQSHMGICMKHLLGFQAVPFPRLQQVPVKGRQLPGLHKAAVQLLQVKPSGVWGFTATSPSLAAGFFGGRLTAGLAMVWKAWHWAGFPKEKCDYQNTILLSLLLLYGTNRHVLQAVFCLCLLKHIFRQTFISKCFVAKTLNEIYQ